MKHLETTKRDLINDDYSIRLVIWTLARQNRRIHACAWAYYKLDMSLQDANEYTKYLATCEIFPLDIK